MQRQSIFHSSGPFVCCHKVITTFMCKTGKAGSLQYHPSPKLPSNLGEPRRVNPSRALLIKPSRESANPQSRILPVPPIQVPKKEQGDLSEVEVVWQHLTMDTQLTQGASPQAPPTGSLKGYNRPDRFSLRQAKVPQDQ